MARPITVKDLIERLHEFPEDSLIVVDDEKIDVAMLVRHVGAATIWKNEHGVIEFSEGGTPAVALVIGM